MNHLDHELKLLKDEINSMWLLVISQLHKTQQALLTYDQDLAREVLMNEKRVDAMELKIDLDCENLIALFNPVAIDLRFILAGLKINNNLERIGDIAKGIAKLIVQTEQNFDQNLIESTETNIMFEEAIDMLSDLQQVFESENTKEARKIFARDEILNEINHKINTTIQLYIQQNPDKIDQALNIHSTIRKLERIGDQTTNIAEEIIFFIEAKVLKHSKKYKKQE